MECEIEQNEKEETVTQWILSIKTKDGKLIGIIRVREMQPGHGFLKIHIPNKNWVHKYGTEAVDQCVKICKEMKDLSTLALESENEIIERYCQKRAINGYQIEFV